jgi:hypothetical protein
MCPRRDVPSGSDPEFNRHCEERKRRSNPHFRMR